MFRYQRELDAIKETLGRLGLEIDFRPASPGDIGYMQGMLYPDSVIEFYANAEPSSWFVIEDIQFNQIANMWGENEDTLPGNRAILLGLLNIASTDEGDTYCVDLNTVDSQDEPMVRWVSRHITETMSDEDVMHHTHVVANTFSDFLMKFAKGELGKRPHVGHEMPPPMERTTFQPHHRAA